MDGNAGGGLQYLYASDESLFASHLCDLDDVVIIGYGDGARALH